MRRIALASVGIVIVALLAACGGGTHALATVAGAASKTTAAHTAKASITMKSDSGIFAKGVTQEGAFDFTNRRGRLEVDAGSFGLTQLQGTIEAVFEFTPSAVIYMHFPQLAGEFPGKEWLKLDIGAAAKQATGVDLNSVIQGQSSDPSQGLGQLRGATQVTEVGKETVRDTETTHYALVVDLNKAAQESPAASRDAMQKLADLYKVKTVAMEVWLDGDGRVRRERYTIDIAQLNLPASTTANNPLTGKIDYTVEYYDFGTTVDATPPPPAQTEDLADLLAKLHSRPAAKVAQPS